MSREAFEKWAGGDMFTFLDDNGRYTSVITEKAWQAWQAAQAQAVNQQLLEAIKVCASFLSDFGLENSDAYQQALFAIEAAQEQSSSRPAKGEK